MAGVLVHEWLSRIGGSERVFDAMVEAFPEADILTLWNDDPEHRYSGRHVQESWLARTPLRRSKALALPFMAPTWRNRRGAYDWALVSSHAFAHHVSFRSASEDFRKYVYVHTPARYIWNPELDARGQGILPRVAAPSLRSLDRRRAQEATHIAANSSYVQSRIARAWGRDSTVIHPPVEVDRIQAKKCWADELGGPEAALLGALPRPFVLGASRLIPYKRLDLVIAAGDAADLPVVIAGSGPEQAILEERAASARVPVVFIQQPSDALLYALYESALVYVFPAVEDFGIMPVEAMAAGAPVLVGAVGGTRETVIDGVTGASIESWQPNDMVTAIESCERMSADACRDRARAFTAGRFREELSKWIALGEAEVSGRGR